MAKESKFAKELRKMKGSWADSRKEYEHTFGGQKIPEAVYTAKIQDCKLGLTKSAKKLYIGREFLILKGEYKGIPVRDMLHLCTDKGPIYARQFIEMMGHKAPPDDEPERLEKVIAEIRKDALTCKIRVTHSGDFTNVRVTEVTGGKGMSKEYDLEDMSKKQLLKLIDKEDLDVDPDDYDDVDELRDAVEEALDDQGGDDDDDDDDDDKDSDKDSDDADFDDMDKDELLEYIEEKEIDPEDLGFKNEKKMKKADEDELREALEEYKDNDKGDDKDNDDNDDNDDDDDDKKSKKGKGRKGKKGDDEEDELLEKAKTFCGAWDIDIDDDASLKEVKKAIAEDDEDFAEYPEDELDEDEIELLKELGLENCIKKSKKSKKDKEEKGSKKGKKGKK